MREETGDFGELVYAGMDWVDPALAKRSMQLMAEEVMPRVNAAIGKQASARRSRRSATHQPCAMRQTMPASAPINSAPQAKAWIAKPRWRLSAAAL